MITVHESSRMIQLHLAAMLLLASVMSRCDRPPSLVIPVPVPVPSFKTTNLSMISSSLVPCESFVGDPHSVFFALKSPQMMVF